MGKYIDKDIILAEIERRIKYDEMVMDHDAQITELLSRELNTLYELSSFIKSLDTKEVDLKKEFDNYAKDILACDVQFKPFTHLYKCAQYFYELGLNAKKEE